MAILAISVASSCRMMRSSVPGIEATTVIHPTEVILEGVKKTYYFFYALDKQSLFVSDKKVEYDEISKWLPTQRIPGRFVTMQGTSIGPFTLFNKEERDKIKTAGISLNGYKLYKLTGFNLENESSKNSPSGTNQYRPTADEIRQGNY